jgi:hypothetical protein
VTINQFLCLLFGKWHKAEGEYIRVEGE